MALHPDVDRRGKPGGKRNQLASPLDEAVHQGFHRRVRLGRLGTDLGVEQRLRDDLKGQFHHVGLDVANLSVFPGSEHPIRELDHDGGITGDPITMKRRLYELAPGPPELSLAGQEAVAQRSLRASQPVMLDELPVLIDEHVLDKLGMVDEKHGTRAKPGGDHVSEFVMPARVSVPRRSRLNSLRLPESQCCFGPGGRGRRELVVVLMLMKRSLICESLDRR